MNQINFDTLSFQLCSSSQEIVAFCEMSIELAPLFVLPSDGNCFLNALSIVHKGDLTLSEQLRLLCSLELILHAEYYQNIHDDLGLDVVSKTFVDACRDAVNEKKWSSVWLMLSAATAPKTLKHDYYIFLGYIWISAVMFLAHITIRDFCSSYFNHGYIIV